MSQNVLLAVFLAGLLGGGHCAAMCGDPVGAVSAGAAILFALSFVPVWFVSTFPSGVAIGLEV